MKTSRQQKKALSLNLKPLRVSEPPCVLCCRYRMEMESVLARWRRLGATLTDNGQRLKELTAKLLQFEVRGALMIAWSACFSLFIFKIPVPRPTIPERRQDFEEVDGRRGRVPERGVAGPGRLRSSGEAAGAVHGEQADASPPDLRVQPPNSSEIVTSLPV